MLEGFPHASSTRVVITGGVATGKTTLLRTFVERASDSGALSLCAVASRVERDVPLAVLEQLFRSPDLPPASAERATHWLDIGVRSTSGREPALAGGAGQVPAMVLRGLWQVMR